MAVGAQPGAAPDKRPGFFANVGALVLARGFLTASQILVLPVLARYLSVAEFALMALAMSVVIFANVLSDAGLGRSLIRSPGFDLSEWSTVFWLLVGVGVLLCLGVLGLAPLWAWWFDQPDLLALLAVLSMVPLCQAVSAAFNAEIERREAYTALAKLQVVAAASGLVAAVVLALAGFGVWALVVQQVLLAGIRMVGVVALSQFRPRLEFARHHLGAHLRFSRDTIATSLITVAQNEGATIIIAKLLGALPLGVFAMSQRFTRLPQFGLAGPMSAVVYVRMAKAQDSPERLVGIYLASTRLLAAALMPAMAMVAAAGPEIFSLFLSEKWASVAPVFALSIPGLVLEAATITCLTCLFRAVARTDLQVRLVSIGTCVRLALVLCAATISLEAVAASLTIWALVLVPLGWRMARRIVPLEIGAALGALAGPVVISLFAAGAYLFAWKAVTPGGWQDIAVAAALTCLAYGAVAVADWARLREAVAIFR